MKHLFLITLLMLLCGSVLFAQIYNSHIFSTTTGTYTEITGTTISDIQTDDEISDAIDIGFTFLYGIEPFTQVKVSSNGWIGLGTGASGSNLTNQLIAATTYPVLAPLWDDLSLSDGNCQYATTGTAPTRVFTVQYQNESWNYNADNQFNFQVKLYENGKIEFRYGTSTGTPSSANASIGININPGGSQYFYSVTPGTPATVSYVAENNLISAFPGNGVIYTFDIVAPVPNDMAALSILGNLSPTAGTASNYTVMVRNMGTAAQSNYSVKLMNGATILASVAGPALAPGISQNVVVPWIPQSPGPMAISGKVVLAGDSYPQNDTTSPLNVIVQAAGTTVITIGAGDQMANMPVNMYWKNSLFETIYPAEEIAMGGMITGISFYNNFVTNLPQKPTKIWLGLTQQSDLSTGWIPSTDLSLVFDGLVDYPSGINTITIPLPLPFVYAGSNLVMMVQRPTDTIYFSSMDQFYCQLGGANRTLHIFNDVSPYDPAIPPEGATLTGLYPKTALYFIAPNPNPQFSVAPSAKNFGTVLLNSTASQVFTMLNIGGGNLSISNISISGSPFITMHDLPTLPVTLASLQGSTFGVQYHPTAAGIHTANIIITDNLTRTQHTVLISGECMDPTIYTSPYVQNFDTVTAPTLPLDWNKIYTGGDQWGYIRIESGNAYTPPNCVSMYNSGSTASEMLLIAPPLANSLIMPAMRVKFRAKGGNGSTLQVGVIADINDAATFSSLITQNLTTTWAEYVVNLQNYTGGGRYIAFKHGNSNMYDNLYIDAVTIENTPQNDLAALSISGTNIPSVNIAASYTVTLFNWGTSPQSNYTVKLYKTGNVELASIPGPTIAPGVQATATLSWTPSIAENTQIYGKVILTGDQNPLNDQTNNMNITIQASGTTIVTIGAGDQVARIPVDMFYKNSLFETIYDAAGITAGGAITSIAFFNNFVTNLPQKPTKIWLGSTDQSDLSAGWISSTNLTLVFDGLVDYPSGLNTIIIPLTTPFNYPGTNLVMMVNRPMDTQYFSFNDQFLSQSAGTNRCLSASSDGESYDPANPPTGWLNLSGITPKTAFFFAPAGPNPLFGVAPSAKNFGTILLNATRLQTFTIFNSGGAPLTINSISISGSPMFTIQNLPTLPYTLNSGQNTTFVGRYHPTAAGTHAATITIGDNLGRATNVSFSRSSAIDLSASRAGASRTQHAVLLSGVCTDPTIYTSPYSQNFDTVTVPALPIDWQALVQVTNSNAYVQTTSGDAHSLPNYVSMYNYDNTSGDIMLIAPPLVNTLNVTGMRIKFWARGFGYPLEVGVIADVADPATFTSTTTINPGEEWSEYVVSFQTYTGGGNTIAFRHGLGGMYEALYIDDAVIETIPQNDLAALSISGNSTPSVGMVTNYTVNVFNWGTNPQSTYTVKLFKEGNIEIASVPGPLVNPGLSVPVALSWAPTAVGNSYIYGKVILTGDQNNLNNQTPNLNVSIQPAGTMVVTVGDGTQEARMPLDMYYHNSLFETIYLSTELNFMGIINGIAFYNDFMTDLPNMPTNIWLGTTTQTDLSTGWIPNTDMTQVFSGNVNYPSGENVITIMFPQPYLHLEGNMVMLVERPMDSVYYNSQDLFYCQTVGANRSRNVYSDQTDYDPAAPPVEGGSLTGQFPKTSFFAIPVGVGQLSGNVYGAGNVPLANTTVQIVNGATVTTNAQGHYQIMNIVAGTYQVTASRYGYISQTISVIIPEDGVVTQNFTLAQMPTVTVTGRLVGSDLPNVGLAGATLSVVGYENYNVTANAQGQFTIPGVYTNQSYNYTATHAGYQNRLGSFVVAGTNLNLGDVTLFEIAYTPRSVSAAVVATNNTVNINWLAPDPNAVDITQSFENPTFPPTDWTRVVTNNGAANPSGVFPTWCRFGTVVDGTITVAPSEGSWQCGFWWTYSHQDEWLITPQFNCPQGASLTFGTYVTQGSANGDHYYVKISADNGVTWDILWDASTLPIGVNNYQTPVQISLTDYAGQQVKIAWHADDPNTSNDGMWYNWFIDNVVIGNNVRTIKFAENQLTTRSAAQKETQPLVVFTNLPMSRDNSSSKITAGREANTGTANHKIPNRNRSLQGYRVWRLAQGQEQNENSWVSLTPDMITATTFNDATWSTLLTGTFKWAIKGVYTNGVLSLAAFSNAITVPTAVTGTLTGTVRNAGNVPIMGAVITAGLFTTTTTANGGYSMLLPIGTYSVVCTATGYQTITHPGVVITQGQTTVSSFTMPVGNEDEVNVEVTSLNANYPNPFNPSTTISFDIKTKSPVRVEIYNTKGQLIRTLVNEVKASGRYRVIWNGKDENGTSVASGIYHYRMQAGDYKVTRRMMLLK